MEKKKSKTQPQKPIQNGLSKIKEPHETQSWKPIYLKWTQKTIIYHRKCQIELCKSFFLKLNVKIGLCFCDVPFMIKFVLLFLKCPIYDRVRAVTFEMSCLWLSLCCYFWGVPYLCCCFTGSVWLWSGQWWWMGGGGTRREPISIWGTNWLIDWLHRALTCCWQ